MAEDTTIHDLRALKEVLSWCGFAGAATELPLQVVAVENRKSEFIEMNREEMKARTKAYANRVVRLCSALPGGWIARRLGDQLLRSGTSVGANYRAVCRAKSTADFINKLRLVEEECDESLFWMELLIEHNIVNEGRLQPLMSEGNEILSIVVSSAKSARQS